MQSILLRYNSPLRFWGILVPLITGLQFFTLTLIAQGPENKWFQRWDVLPRTTPICSFEYDGSGLEVVDRIQICIPLIQNGKPIKGSIALDYTTLDKNGNVVLTTTSALTLTQVGTSIAAPALIDWYKQIRNELKTKLGSDVADCEDELLKGLEPIAGSNISVPKERGTSLETDSNGLVQNCEAVFVFRFIGKYLSKGLASVAWNSNSRATFIKTNKIPLKKQIRCSAYLLQGASKLLYDKLLKVIPLDYQTGYNLSSFDIDGNAPSGAPLADAWFSNALLDASNNKLYAQAYINPPVSSDWPNYTVKYYPTRYPSVIFGEAIGGTPLPVGHVFRQALVGPGLSSKSDTANEVIIRAFRKDEPSTHTDFVIDLPRPSPGYDISLGDPLEGGAPVNWTEEQPTGLLTMTAFGGVATTTASTSLSVHAKGVNQQREKARLGFVPLTKGPLVVGLKSSSSNQVDFAFNLDSAGIRIWESGNLVSTIIPWGTYSTGSGGTQFEIRRDDGVISYWIQGIKKYVSLKRITVPLSSECWLGDLGVGLSKAWELSAWERFAQDGFQKTSVVELILPGDQAKTAILKTKLSFVTGEADWLSWGANQIGSGGNHNFDNPGGITRAKNWALLFEHQALCDAAKNYAFMVGVDGDMVAVDTEASVFSLAGVTPYHIQVAHDDTWTDSAKLPNGQFGSQYLAKLRVPDALIPASNGWLISTDAPDKYNQSLPNGLQLSQVNLPSGNFINIVGTPSQSTTNQTFHTIVFTDLQGRKISRRMELNLSSAVPAKIQSSASIPLSRSVAASNGRAHTFAYGFDISPPLPQTATTLLDAPHFEGVPLPSRYLGKTEEEILQSSLSANRLDWQFVGKINAPHLFEPIQWTQLESLRVSTGSWGGTDISNVVTTTTAWESCALSSKALYSDAQVEFLFKPGAVGIIGLMALDAFTDETTPHRNKLTHALQCDAAKNIQVIENGIEITMGGSPVKIAFTNADLDCSDVFSIVRRGYLVTYLRNGIPFYESQSASLGKVWVGTIGNLNVSNAMIRGCRYRGVDIGDSDNDGLDDNWEQTIIDGDLAHRYSVLADVRPEEDADGDTISNSREFAEGSDPLDPFSSMIDVNWKVSALVGFSYDINTKIIQRSKATSSTPVWDSDAISENALIGDGRLRFKSMRTDKAISIGLTHVNDNHSFTDQEFAIRLQTTGKALIVERDKSVDTSEITFDIGSYLPTTLFEIVRKGDTVSYRKDGKTVRLSLVTNTERLYVDVSSPHFAAGLSEVRLITGDGDGDSLSDRWEREQLEAASVGRDNRPVSGVSLTKAEDFDLDGVSDVEEKLDGTNPNDAHSLSIPLQWQTTVTVNGVITTRHSVSDGANIGGLKKSGGTNGAWDADAISSSDQRILQNGRLIFQFARNDTNTICGLNSLDADRSATDIDFGIYGKNNGHACVYEGTTGTDLGDYDPSTIFIVERLGSEIRYWKNGKILWTSIQQSTATLFADSALCNTNSAITSAKIVDGDTDNDGLPDTWERSTLGDAAVDGTTNLGNFVPPPDPKVTNSDTDSVMDYQEYLDGTIPVGAEGIKSYGESIEWTEKFSTSTPSGTTTGALTRTGTAAWNAGAVSSKKIIGDGRLLFQIAENTKALMVGLSYNNEDITNVNIDYAFYPKSDGTVEIVENNEYVKVGSVNRSFGDYTRESWFAIERRGRQIIYLINNIEVYVSERQSAGPMLADCCLHSGSISVARYVRNDTDEDGIADNWEIENLTSGAVGTDNSATRLDTDGQTDLQEYLDGTDPNDEASFLAETPLVWISRRNTEVLQTGGLAGNLRKAAAGGGTTWNADAHSEHLIPGDGKVKFRLAQTNKGIFVGLSGVSSNPDEASTGTDSASTDIDFAIYATSTGTAEIRESGTAVENLGKYVAATNTVSGTQFEIRRKGETITVWKDGALCYVSRKVSAGSLMVDCSFLHTQGAIFDASYACGDDDFDGIPDAWEVANFDAVIDNEPDGTDSDAISDWKEFIDRTNPNSAVNSLPQVPGKRSAASWTALTKASEIVGGTGGLVCDPSATTTWSKGASSVQYIPNNGRLTFRLGQNTKNVSVGLNTYSVGNAQIDLDYGIVCGNNVATIREQTATSLFNLGTYTSNTEFTIERKDGAVRYYKNNLLVYISAKPSSGALRADCSFNAVSATISQAYLVGETITPFDSSLGQAPENQRLLELDNSWELAAHPILDEFVERVGNNPMALANFVLNDIELVDPISLSQKGASIDYTQKILRCGGINRHALEVFQERKGSPIEQCGLLVYLLRKAGYPAAYVFPDDNKVKLLDTTVSKLLQMQIAGMRNSGTGEPNEVPHEISVTYPWVTTYIDGKWVHLFPWLKDMEVVEGLDIWPYMPAEIDTPIEWTSCYIKKQEPAWDEDARNETPLETLKRKFQKHLAANFKGKDISMFGYSATLRKHHFTDWKAFPQPFRVLNPSSDAGFTFIPKLDPTKNFDKVWIRIFDEYSDYNELDPDTQVLDTGFSKESQMEFLPVCMLYNRRPTISTTSGNVVRFSLEPFRATAATKIANNWNNIDSMSQFVKAQEFKKTIPASHPEVNLVVRFLRPDYDTGVRLWENTASTRFLNTSSHQERFDFIVSKNTTAILSTHCGSVSSRTVLMQAAELQSYFKKKPLYTYQKHSTPSPAPLAEMVGSLLGLTYFQRVTESDRELQNLLKVRIMSATACDVVRWNHADYTAPSLDVLDDRYFSVAGDDLKPDSNGQNRLNVQAFHILSGVESSALEHVVFNRLFPTLNTDSVSTVNLLHRATDADKKMSSTHPDLAVDHDSAELLEMSLNEFLQAGRAHTLYGGKTVEQWFSDTILDDVETLLSFNGSEFARIFMTAVPQEGVRGKLSGMGLLCVGPDPSMFMALISGGLHGSYGYVDYTDLGYSGYEITDQSGNVIGYGYSGVVQGDGYSKGGAYMGSFVQNYYQFVDVSGSPSAVMLGPQMTASQFQSTFGAAVFRDSAGVAIPFTTSGRSFNYNGVTLKVDGVTLDVAVGNSITQGGQYAADHGGDYDPIRTPKIGTELIQSLTPQPQPPSSLNAEAKRNLGQTALNTGVNAPARPPVPSSEAAADPVNVMTGEFGIDEIDLELPGAIPFQIRRNYSTRTIAGYELGYGWRFSFQPFLQLKPGDTQIYGVELDGAVLNYRRRTDNLNIWEVYFDDNPELKSYGVNPLYRNWIERTGNGDSGTLYTVHGWDGSVRVYVVRAFPLSKSIVRKRPYLYSWSDSSGNTLKFVFYEDINNPGSYGQVKSVKSSGGQVINYLYSSSGFISEIVSSDGRSVLYEINQSGDLVAVVRADNSITRYRYGYVNKDGATIESMHLDPKVAAAVNNKVTSTHLLVEITNPDGRVLENQYETEPVAATAPLGPQKYTKLHRVKKQLSNVGQDSSASDVASSLSVNTPADESYEPRLVAEFDYGSDLLDLDPTDPLWSTRGWNPSTELPIQEQKDINNKPNGKFTGTVKLKDAYGRQTVYQFANNLLLKTTDPLKHVQTITYCPDVAVSATGEFRRSIKQSIDQRGVVTDYAYDMRGNVSCVTVTGDLDGDGSVGSNESHVTKMYYNERDLLVATVSGDKDTGTADYTPPGDWSSVVDVPTTGTLTRTYFEDVRYPYLPTKTLIKAKNAGVGYSIISQSEVIYGEIGTGLGVFANGLPFETRNGLTGDQARTKWTYNKFGLAETMTQYSGVTGGGAADYPDVVTTLLYNDRHELSEMTDMAGNKTKYSYDDMGRRIWNERFDSTGKQVDWNYVYYNHNGEVEWTDGARSSPDDFTYSRYDGMGRVVEKVAWRSQAKEDGSGLMEVPGIAKYATTKMGYNLAGDLVRVMDPLGNITRVAYDNVGRPISRTSYQGDEAGTVLDSSTVTYVAKYYDSMNVPVLGTPLLADYAKAVDDYTESVSFTGGKTRTYTSNMGSPRMQLNADGTVVEWRYYRDGRIKEEPLSATLYAYYTYDDGQRKQMKEIRRRGDDSARRGDDSARLGVMQVVTFDARGNTIQSSDIAGYEVTTSYDHLGRVKSATQPHLSSVVSPPVAATFKYDLSHSKMVVCNAAVSQRVEVITDALGRLKSEQILDNTTLVSETTYQYGSSGDTTALDDHNGVSIFVGNGTAAPRLKSRIVTNTFGQPVIKVDTGGTTSVLHYDVVGNLVRSVQRGIEDGNPATTTKVSSTSLTYDALGRMLTSTLPDTHAVAFTNAYLYGAATSGLRDSIVAKSMPGPATGSAAPQANGLTQYQVFDPYGRLKEEFLSTVSPAGYSGITDSQKTRRLSYSYYPAQGNALASPSTQTKNDGLVNTITEQVIGSTNRTHLYTYDDWSRVETYSCGSQSAAEYVQRSFTWDVRGLVAGLLETTGVTGGQTTTNVLRGYDAQGRLEREGVYLNGTLIRHFINGYDAVGDRTSLSFSEGVFPGSGNTTTTAKLGGGNGTNLGFQWYADGALKKVTAGSQEFDYQWGTNGLLTQRCNTWRTQTYEARDLAGRPTATRMRFGKHLAGDATGTTCQSESMTWDADSRLKTHGLNTPGTTPATASRTYTYDIARRRLTSESLGGSAGTLGYQFDHNHPGGLGIRTSAKTGSNATDWQSIVDGAAASGFGRVTDEDTNDFRKTVTATGTAAGARSVTATLQDEVAAKPLEYVGPTDAAGGWVLPLNLKPGDYTLRANALTMANVAVAPDVRHYSVLRSATLDHVTSVLDDEGKTTERRYSGSGKVQTLIWDALGRLTRVSERDGNGSGGNGYDWSAIYDGLGRRLRTETKHFRVTVPFPSGTQIGDTCTEDSWFDPLHEFLEIGLEVTWTDKTSHSITSHTRTWKIHGVDANGEYGGLQGVGGLEAVVDEETGTWTALVDDYHGHIIGSIETANTVRWSLTQCSGYGPAQGSPVFVVAEGASVVQATAWRGQRLDVTGFYCLGARYYEPTSGRFLSPDPLGHGASLSLYDYAGGDPINLIDPTGRNPVSPIGPSQPPTPAGGQGSQAQPPMPSPFSYAGGGFGQSSGSGHWRVARAIESPEQKRRRQEAQNSGNGPTDRTPPIPTSMHSPFSNNSTISIRTDLLADWHEIRGVSSEMLDFAPGIDNIKAGTEFAVGQTLAGESVNRKEAASTYIVAIIVGHGATKYGGMLLRWGKGAVSDGINALSPKLRIAVGDAGHHVPAVRKSAGRPELEVLRGDKSRPTIHPLGDDPGHEHWQLHDAERKYVGPRQGDFDGTDDELMDAYRSSYENLTHLKVDVRSPDGKVNLGSGVTPREAVDLIDYYLRGNRK